MTYLDKTPKAWIARTENGLKSEAVPGNAKKSIYFLEQRDISYCLSQACGSESIIRQFKVT